MIYGWKQTKKKVYCMTKRADYCYFVIVQVSLISTARHGPYTRRIQKRQCQWWLCQWHSSKIFSSSSSNVFMVSIFYSFTGIRTSGIWGKSRGNNGKYGTTSVLSPRNRFMIFTVFLPSWGGKSGENLPHYDILTFSIVQINRCNVYFTQSQMLPIKVNVN